MTNKNELSVKEYVFVRDSLVIVVLQGVKVWKEKCLNSVYVTLKDMNKTADVLETMKRRKTYVQMFSSALQNSSY